MHVKELYGDMLLRPMLEEDLAFMLDIRNEVRDLMNDNRIFTFDEALEWYHTKHPENYIAVVGGHDVGVMRVRRRKQHIQSAEVGGDIHKTYRRKGYGLRAYNLLIPYLFNDPSTKELFLEVLESNMPAFNLYHKLGFEIHEWKPKMARRPGHWVSGFVMNLTKRKWNEGRQS